MNWYKESQTESNVNLVQMIADKMAEYGWTYEEAMNMEDLSMNPNAMNIGSYTYPTLVSQDGKVKLGLSRNDLYPHKNYVMVGDSYSARDDQITLSGIIVDPSERKSGRGNEAMQQLLSVAKEIGVKVVIEPAPIHGQVGRGKPGLNSKKLRKWYEDMGFVNKYPDSNAVMILDQNEDKDELV